MRIIDSGIISDAVEKLCIEANVVLCSDVLDAVKYSIENEESVLGKEVLKKIIENAETAKIERIPICQDTGMAVFFVELGKDVFIEGVNLSEAIDIGVKRGYISGYLRKSIVKDPIIRVNTNDNTPSVIYYEMVDGDKIKIDFMPKGFGSENMSGLKMLTPSDGIDGIKQFVIETVNKAGSNPCPPIIVGVGIGGTMDKAAVLAKKALLREIGKKNEFEHLKRLEDELLESINDLGIGPAGLGGRITALAVNILTYPTHIAGLPVAVNISCHATRHKQVII